MTVDQIREIFSRNLFWKLRLITRWFSGRAEGSVNFRGNAPSTLFPQIRGFLSYLESDNKYFVIGQKNKKDNLKLSLLVIHDDSKNQGTYAEGTGISFAIPKLIASNPSVVCCKNQVLFDGLKTAASVVPSPS